MMAVIISIQNLPWKNSTMVTYRFHKVFLLGDLLQLEYSHHLQANFSSILSHLKLWLEVNFLNNKDMRVLKAIKI